jgi:hypothetical protein
MQKSRPKLKTFKSPYARELSFQKLKRRLERLAQRRRLEASRKIVKGGCIVLRLAKMTGKPDPSRLQHLRVYCPELIPTEFKLLQFRKRG